MKSLIPIACLIVALALNASESIAGEKNARTVSIDVATTDSVGSADTPSLHWRDDPAVKRRPASYVGGSLNYVQLYTWLEKNDDHKALKYGPLHSGAGALRVGDAFGDHIALGFQVQFLNSKAEHVQISAFALLLDLSIYPWKGLGIRPSAGFGFGFAQGENKWEFGFGGPGTLAMSLLYEFRITRKMTIAPVITTTWMTADGYDGLFALAGIEMLFWIPNRNRYKD
ncbi:MAG: hypothetical protein JXR76_19735 [Deltaproteobacteria bacterium]|nr:hypothetical protein [Deltaproteobacteria bacterium]